MTGYLRPTALEEAAAALARTNHRILAGGTDLYPWDANQSAWGRPGLRDASASPVLDLSGIAELRQIEREPDGTTVIGAGVTWRQAMDCGLPAWFDSVRLAGREVGGVQIQNRGTLAGNLCNASPAADGVPALLVLDTRVRLVSASGTRELALADFITGNRRVARREDELVSALVIPPPPAALRSTFLKLGARRYLVISIAMVAVAVAVDDGRIAHCAIAVGACSEVARRLPTLESRLLGMELAEAGARLDGADFAGLTPLSDLRASASYRHSAALELTRRSLNALVRTATTQEASGT